MHWQKLQQDDKQNSTYPLKRCVAVKPIKRQTVEVAKSIESKPQVQQSTATSIAGSAKIDNNARSAPQTASVMSQIDVDDFAKVINDKELFKSFSCDSFHVSIDNEVCLFKITKM